MEVLTPRSRGVLSKKRKQIIDDKSHRITVDMRNIMDEATYFEV